MKESFVIYPDLGKDPQCPEGCKRLDDFFVRWRVGEVADDQFDQELGKVLSQLFQDLSRVYLDLGDPTQQKLEIAQRVFVHMTMRVCVIEHLP